MNHLDLYAANFARIAAQTKGEGYLKLSALMCWDAVRYCALKSNIIDLAEFNLLAGRRDMVTIADSRIVGKNAMQGLPQGHAIGFFNGNTLIHLMISLGRGKAAGNKNDCVGLGKPVGWEILELSQLQWRSDGNIDIPRGIVIGNRGQHTIPVTLRARPLSMMRYAGNK